MICDENRKILYLNELFVYKVLEKLELGPKSNFIMTFLSISGNSTKICHIVTEDVEYSNDKNIRKKFFTDVYISSNDNKFEAF